MQEMRKKLIRLIAGIILAVYAFYRRDTVLSIAAVLFFAGVMVLLLAPVCTRMEKRGIPSSVSSLLSVLLLVFIVLLLLSVFIPYLAVRTASILRRCAPAVHAFAAEAEQILQRLGIDFLQSKRMTGILEGIVPDAAQRVTSFFARVGMTVAEQAGRFCFSLVISYYVLCERKNIGKALLLCVPLHFRTRLIRMLRSCSNAMLGYISGLFKCCAFIGSATYAGLVCIGVPDALLLSVFMGVFECLPYAGPVLAAVPILMSAATLGVKKALLSLGLVCVVQMIEGNIVGPYFSSSSTDIHPLIVIVSIFICGSFFGFWGILLAVPAAAAARCVSWTIKQWSAE